MAFGQPQQQQPSTGGFNFSFSSSPAFGAAAGSSAAPAASSGGFSFGGASSAAAPAPAFGAPATSTPAFGGSTGGGFSFGGSSTPAFGASSTPAFGASSTAAFGAAPAPAFGQTPPQPSLFGGFGGQQQQQQQQQPQLHMQQQQQQQQVPFTRASTFESLPKDVQQQLQQIQEQVSKYDADRAKVQQLTHLQEAPAQQQGLDAEIASVRGELKELSALIKAQEEGLQDFKEKSQQLLKATDIVVRTYQRNKEWRESMMRGDQVNLQKYLTLPVMLPGPYVEEAVQGMTETVGEFSRVLDEVEQVLASSSLQDPSQVDWRTVLPTIVSNMHDYFISVAAKLEKTHSEVERLKPLYLACLREQGVYTDPFERARRQEQLQQQQYQQQQQQQRQTPATAAQQQAALHGGPAAAGGPVPALPAPASGGVFGGAQQTPATPGQQATPAFGAGSFGSPFPGTTGFGAAQSPFGGTANNGLSRSASKPKSKKR